MSWAKVFFLGYFLGWFLGVIVMGATLYFMMPGNFINIASVTDGKEFVIENASYRCVKTNELLKRSK